LVAFLFLVIQAYIFIFLNTMTYVHRCNNILKSHGDDDETMRN